MSLIMDVLNRSRTSRDREAPKVSEEPEDFRGGPVSETREVLPQRLVLEAEEEVTAFSNIFLVDADAAPARQGVFLKLMFLIVPAVILTAALLGGTPAFQSSAAIRTEGDGLQLSLPEVLKQSPDPGIQKHSLEGIILGRGEPMCILEGQILRIGESWKGKMILAIDENAVILSGTDGSVFTMRANL